MVLSSNIREKLRQEGREEGRHLGLEEANRRWEEWNQRREQAERDGKQFSEPPPSGRNGQSN